MTSGGVFQEYSYTLMIPLLIQNSPIFRKKKKVTNICLDPLPGYPVELGQLFHPDPCPLVANLTGCHRPHTPFLSEHGPWCCRLVLQPPDLHIHPGLGQLRSVPCTVRETTKSALVSRLPH